MTHRARAYLFVGSILAVLVLAAVVTGSTGRPEPVPTLKAAPTSSPLVSTAAPSTPGATPAATGTITVGKISVAARSVAVPRERRYVKGFGRLLVLDLSARTSAEFARVEIDPFPEGGVHIGLSESADGRLVLLTIAPATEAGAVFLLHLERGEIREVFRGMLTGEARLSPDGKSFALARVSPDPAVVGIWLGTIDGGLTGRLVADAPDRVGSPPTPLGFARDGKTLAVNATGGPGDQLLALVHTEAGETRFDGTARKLVGGDTRMIGPGSALDGLRDGGPLLAKSSSDAFGGQNVVYRTAPDGTERRDVYRPPQVDWIIDQALWKPDRSGMVVVQRPFMFSPGEDSTIVVLDGGGGVVREARHAFLIDIWWSTDGTRLFAATGGDDSVGAIVEVLTGQDWMTYCQRGGDPPSCV